MLDRLKNRGPDSAGIEVLDSGRVVLGHRRLAILDLTELGHQPMCNETRDVWLTFNGEIYNYKELRKVLQDLGHAFKSQTDSEVIIHAYEEWGPRCVEKLAGIFAFGIWDNPNKRLFLARDQLGIKPLYFGNYSKKFVFASQTSAITADPEFRRSINRESLAEFFAYGYVPSDSSIWNSVQQLPPGCSLILQKGHTTVTRYWQPVFSGEITNYNEAVEHIGDALRFAVERQLQSDVPVGTLLSGGIDSTLLTALSCRSPSLVDGRLHSFTMGFDEAASDERQFAQIAADFYHTDHKVGKLDITSFPDNLQAAIEAFDEPFDPNSPMPATAVAGLVREHGVKVVLGGDGGDELFSGYLRYDDFHNFVQAGGPAEQAGGATALHARADKYFRYEGVVSPDVMREILYGRDAPALANVARDRQRAMFREDAHPVMAAQRSDLLLYLPGHILAKVDRATMYHGVEARVPFLDPCVVEAALRIAPEVNYRNMERKAVLKGVASNCLPPQLLTARKKGFSSPIGQWSSPKFKKWGKNLLKNGVLVSERFIQPNALDLLKTPGFQKPLQAHWLLLTAELWARRWYQDGAAPEIATELRKALAE